jgi:hypothetical protein
VPTLTDLKLILYRINDHLLAHPVFVRGRGTPVDDPAHTREIDELDRLSIQLGLVVRELRSKANLLRVREQNLWKNPREGRYGAAASVHDQQAELEKVLEFANDLQAVLEDLIERSSSIGEGEMSQGIGEFIEKMRHLMHTHGEIGQLTDGSAYIPAGKSQVGGSVEAVTLFVFVALRVLVHLRKRGAQGDQNG